MAGVCVDEVVAETQCHRSTAILVHLVYINCVVCQTSCAYSLLKRASKIELAVRGLLACPADFFHVHVHVYACTRKEGYGQPCVESTQVQGPHEGKGICNPNMVSSV